MRIHRESLIIIAVLIIGFVIRMIGIRHGLPGLYHPDEPIVVSRAANAVINGEWNPEFFHWPSLLIYLLAFEYYLIWITGYLSGRFADLDGFQMYYLLNPDVFHFWGRILIAVMGTGSAYFLYLTTKIWFNRPISLIILIIALTTPILVKHSVYVTPDVPAFFASTVIIYMLAKYYFANGRIKYIFISAAFAGVAAAFKYNYGLFLIPVFYLILSDADIKLSRKAMIAFISGVICFISFLLMNPYIVIDFSTFKSQFHEISVHLKEGHIGMESRNPVYELLNYSINGTGIILFFASILGFISALRKHFRWSSSIALFPLIVLFSHSNWPITADRYSLPIVIFILLFVAPIIDIAYRSRTVFKPFAVVVLGVMILQLFIGSGRIISNHMKLDTREVARKWISENIPARSKLAMERDGPYLKVQNALGDCFKEPAYYYFDITPWYGTHFRTQDTPLDLIIKNRPEYVIINSGVYSRYAPGSPSQTDFPEIYAVWRDYYDKLEQLGDLVYEISPSEKLVGPVVRIYKIHEEIYDRVITIPLRISDSE